MRVYMYVCIYIYIYIYITQYMYVIYVSFMSPQLDVPMSGMAPVLTTDCELGDASSLKSTSGCAKEMPHWRPHWQANTAQAEVSLIKENHL